MHSAGNVDPCHLLYTTELSQKLQLLSTRPQT